MDILTEFRSEDFAGQRLHRVPESVRRRMRRSPFVGDLQVTDIGRYPSAPSHLVRRPEGAPGDIFLFVESGRGWIRLQDGPEIPIGTGEAAHIPAGSAHAYGADLKQPWGLYWMHAEGAGVGKLLEWTAFVSGRTVVPCPAIKTIARHLSTAMDQIESGYADSVLLELTRRFVDTLAELARRPGGFDGAAAETEDRVLRAMEWMQNRLCDPLTLEDCARAAGYSVTHFNECFRARNGTTPMQYLRELRIQRACHLLDSTALPVKAVAPAAGYPDPFHFSRAFKATTGMTPTQYRARAT